MENSLGVSIYLKPWCSNGYRIVKLHMTEKIGGSISGGTIDLWLNNSDDSLKLITDQQYGTLILRDTKEDGKLYEIPIFVVSRSFYKNILNLNFVCLKEKSFYTVPVSAEYDDITEALNSLYPGKIDIRIKSDISNNIRIYQTCETNYDLCKRLAGSFKEKSIFAFGWDRFLLKDLCGDKDSMGNKEPKMAVLGNTLLYNTKPYVLNYDRSINKLPYNPWTDIEEGQATTKTDYSEYEFNNCKALVDFDISGYSILGPDYVQLMNNYAVNQGYMNANMYSTLHVSGFDMPSYRLGDVILYSQADQESKYPFTKYLVASNELFYAAQGENNISRHGSKFEWTTILWGLDSGIWSSDNEPETK